MISFKEAKSIAEKTIPSHHLIIETVKNHYGWYFFSNTKQYAETGNFRDMEIGSGGFLVEKWNGRVVEFSSAYSLKQNLKIYEAGLAYGNVDFTVLKTTNFNLAFRLLYNLRMTFVKPEVEHGVEWKIPQDYSEKQLKEILQNLPYTFTNQNFYYNYEEFKKIKNSDCIVYKIKQL